MPDRTPEHDSWMNLWGLAGPGHPLAPAGGTVAPHGADHPPALGARAQQPSLARRAWNGIAQAQADQTAATEVRAQQAGNWAGRAMHTLNGWGASAYNAMPTVVQRGLSRAESVREGVAEGAGTAWNWAGAHITDAARAADGVVRQVGTAADGLATRAVASGTDAIRRHVGDGAATAFQAGAGSLQQTVRTGAQFEYGVTTGILQEGGSMVSGLGTLAGGAYRLTVDGQAREQAASGLARNLVRLDEDPTGVALGAGRGLYHAGANWVQGAQDAAGRGGLSEYLGNGTGHVVGFAASFVAPEALLGKAGEAASVAGRTADAATTASRTTEAVTAGSRTGKGVAEAGRTEEAIAAASRTADATATTGKAATEAAYATRAEAEAAAARGSEAPKGARGPSSLRDFDPEKAGGPVVRRSLDDVVITQEGVDEVIAHTSRFGPDASNEAMISRAREIASGRLEATAEDRAFYSHELDEFQRYRNMGFEAGQPVDEGAARTLWNNTHTAALEDYGLSDFVRDPATGQFVRDPVTGARRSMLYHPSCNPPT